MQLGVVNKDMTAYKVAISIVFGLLGFAANFCFSFSFPPYTAAILIGLLFPILISLTWGWKYGLLSALAGGCQSMWWLWGPSNGYAIFFVAPPFTLWIIWHGICANLRIKQKDHKWWLNMYAVEVPFRILSTINLYTLSRWAITLNPPPWDWAADSTNIIPLHFSNFVVIKQAVVAYIVLLFADVLLKFKFIKTFFKQKEQYSQENTGYIMSAFIAFGILFWVFDSLLGFMVFYDDISFLDLFALNIPPNQIWARSFVFIAGLVGGLITIRVFYRQQESDKALQESEDDFKKLLEGAPIATAILDKNNNTEYANNKYLELVGYNDHINLSDWFILAYPDKDYREWVIKKWNADVEKALREGKEIEPSEYNVTCKDGKVRVMEISGTFVTGKTIAIFTDITERKRAEMVVAESEEKFRLMAENSIDCVWTVDTKLRFTYLSPSVKGIMGFKPEQWVGTTLSSHFRKKEFLKVGVLAAKTFKNYKTFAPITFETKMLNDKNKEIELEISSRVLLNSQGKLIGIQGITRDITERREAERELTKYRDHLEELVRKRTAELDNRVSEVEQLNIEMVDLSKGLQTSNKSLEATTRQLTAANKELGAFAYSVSHDLRAPLRNIDGFSQILLEDYSDILDKQGQHYLNRVRAGTQNMGQLIDDILSLSRSGRHHMDKKTINMESIVREVYRSFKNELKDRKVDFVVHECPPVLADPHLVKIVFTNLLSNALKFTRLNESAKIEISSMTKEGNTVFLVKDNGVGFDMQYADKLFIAFQRLHRAEEYEGSGIGLAIVQRIIYRHGGAIWAESEIGVGTTFYFTLREKK